MNDREKIVLWGAGASCKRLVNNKAFWEDLYEVLGIIDSNSDKWGGLYMGYKVSPPEELCNIQYEKIVITTEIYFDEVRDMLVNEMKIPDAQIENAYFVAKRKIIARYEKSLDMEIKRIIDYLKDNRLQLFNYEFTRKYDNSIAEVEYDSRAGLFYVIHKNKKMYLARRYDTREKAEKYYRSLCIEQDEASPHCYTDDTFGVEEGDVVIDMGVAEGNFSLEVIDKASRIYMIETDSEWIEALSYTFQKYGNKVVIINKFVSDYSLGNTDAVDNLIEDNVNFIKMDIEGCEAEALAGCRKIIERASKLKGAVCQYHYDNDEMKIKSVLQESMLQYRDVTGYIYYPVGFKQLHISPILRKGVIRFEK